MPYNYGTRGAPQTGKGIPGLPSPSNQIITNPTTVVGSTAEFVTGNTYINSNYAPSSYWGNMTSGATPGSATCSAIVNTSLPTDLLWNNPVAGSPKLSEPLPLSNDRFVSLYMTYSNYSTETRIGVFQYNYQSGDVSLASNMQLATDASGGVTAKIAPSVDPNQVLVIRKHYLDSFCRVTLLKVDPGNSAFSTVETTNTVSTSLAESANTTYMFYDVRPLGYFPSEGVEAWLAWRKDGSTPYIIRYNPSTLTLSLSGVSFPLVVPSSGGIFVNLKTNPTDRYFVNFSEPTYSSYFGTTYTGSPYLNVTQAILTKISSSNGVTQNSSFNTSMNATTQGAVTGVLWGNGSFYNSGVRTLNPYGFGCAGFFTTPNQNGSASTTSYFHGGTGSYTGGRIYFSDCTTIGKMYITSYNSGSTSYGQFCDLNMVAIGDSCAISLASGTGWVSHTGTPQYLNFFYLDRDTGNISTKHINFSTNLYNGTDSYMRPSWQAVTLPSGVLFMYRAYQAGGTIATKAVLIRPV